MRKIGLIILVLVLALGATGIGYAAWTDEIVVEGDVSTGNVCLEAAYWAEVNDCDTADNYQNPDPNMPTNQNESDRFWTRWVYVEDSDLPSCPPGHRFANEDGDLFPFGIYCDPELKNVAWVELIGYDEDGIEVSPDDGGAKELKVIIHNAYPYFATEITMYLASCSSIPIRICPEVIDQDDWIILQWSEGLTVGGAQWHEDDFQEVSFFVGVTQHKGYYDGSEWIVDDETKDPLPQDATLSFTIKFNVVQWNEYSECECLTGNCD
jgi:hypothetical protein